MLTFLTILNHASGPYWSMLKRQLAEDDIAPLTITHAPNLIGHPIGLAILAMLGMFILPIDPLFFWYWFGMIAISAVTSVFVIFGLLETKFFTTQVIGSLGFVSASICAAIFLREALSPWTIASLCLGVLGVALFAWKKKGEAVFALDRGMVFTIIAVILGGFSSVLYKLAAFHVTGYAMFFTGRFIGDLIAWTIAWLIGMAIIRKNPASDLAKLMGKRYGQIYMIGTVAMTFLDSYLIYNLPVITLAMLGTISFPVMYFISYFKYKEKITSHMLLGTFCIISSIILFLVMR